MTTHSSILAWRSHGQRSLVGCSPWSHKELDVTEPLTTRAQSLIFHRHNLLLLVKLLKDSFFSVFKVIKTAKNSITFYSGGSKLNLSNFLNPFSCIVVF